MRFAHSRIISYVLGVRSESLIFVCSLMKDAKAMQRAKSRTSPDFCRAGKDKYSTMVVVFMILAALIPARVVTAKPAPSPAVPSPRNIQLPLWQTSLSLSSLNSIPVWQSAASVASLGMNSGTSKKRIPLHHFDLSCSNCHDPANATEDRKMRGQTIWRMSVDINRACSSSGCHDYNPVLNHPVGVSVSGAIPDDLPLDDSARITCLTCHIEPVSSTDAGTEDSQDERMLRMPDGADLCSSCHLRMVGMGQGQSHWRFSNRAHLGPINARSNSSQIKVYTIGGVDSESRSCLSCHEDITVTIPGYSETAAQKAARWRKMGDHPIGMDYSRIAMRKMGKYNYPLINAGQIRFFDGKVGCGSCHSLYSQERKYLVQSNFRSALCFECHNM